MAAKALTFLKKWTSGMHRTVERMTECYNVACPYCVGYQCRRTCTCDMRLDGEYVKIVRCKDCKHSLINESHPNKPLICVLTRKCGTTTGEWYCADGERKDEAEE